MRVTLFVISLFSLLAIPFAAFTQNYIWEENFNFNPGTWTLESNWSISNGSLYFNWSPSTTNYNLSATSPLIYIPETTGNLHVTQYATYFSYVNETFEIAVLVGDVANVIWTHTGPGNWGYSGGQLLTLPLTQFQNQNVRLRFRSFGSNTWNTDGWWIYHVGVEGPTGSLNGYVYNEANNNPLANTNIEILNTIFQATTNSNGFFSFPVVPTGSYDVLALLVGYDPYIMEDVVIAHNQTTTISFYLIQLDNVTLTGQVVGSDQPDVGIENATVSLSGYNNYNTVTSNNGLFSIPEVYCGQTYTITVVTAGYSPYTGEITVGQEDLNIGAVIVDEIAYPPHNIVAVLNVCGTQVNLTWQAPSRLDYIDSESDQDRYSRVLEGYIVFRLAAEDIEYQPNWTELATIEQNYYTDTSINTELNGEYCYGVQAMYTNNVLSESVLSNTIFYEEVIPEIANLQAVVIGYEVHLSWEIVTDRELGNLANPEGSNTNMQKVSQSDKSDISRLKDEAANRELLGFSITRNGILIVTGVTATEYIDYDLAAGEYTYAVIGEYTNGSTNMLEVETVVYVSIEDAVTIEPSSTALLGNNPNPFNPATTIIYTTDSDMKVTIEIFNIRGQHIKTFVNNHHSAGTHTILWEGKDENGRDVGSGIYFYRMKGGSYTSTMKMILIK